VGVTSRDWVRIGTVTTDSCTLALCDPLKATTLADTWHENLQAHIDTDDGQPELQFRELDLGDWQRGLLVKVWADAIYDVDARFDDLDGNGRLSVSELRLRLDRPRWSEDEAKPGPGPEAPTP
jgi:hypothetical protein